DAGHPSTLAYFYFKWNKLGRHQVICGEDLSGKRVRHEYEQQVEEIDSILARQMAASKKSSLPDPRYELSVTEKWVELLTKLAAQPGVQMSEQTLQQHSRRVGELGAYVRQLRHIISRCGNDIVPFRAAYLAKEDMQDHDLRVFVTHPAGD